MDREYLIKAAEEFVENSEGNYISEELAISDNLVGMKIFDAPIFAFGLADDEYFTKLKEESVIGEHFLAPKEWLPEAKTVISFFLPFTEQVRVGNKVDMEMPSEEWLHGRIEGQEFLISLSKYLKDKLIDAGYNSLIPSLDNRFESYNKEKFTSNWSERHVAFVCGLGTFGLAKNLITEKGAAGRFGSIVTDLDISPDERYYEGIWDNCGRCAKCMINCPAGAISIENGKDNRICADYLDRIKEKTKPRYGCGKCQVDVPCESKVPFRFGLQKF